MSTAFDAFFFRLDDSLNVTLNMHMIHQKEISVKYQLYHANDNQFDSFNVMGYNPGNQRAFFRMVRSGIQLKAVGLTVLAKRHHGGLFKPQEKWENGLANHCRSQGFDQEQ